MSSITTPTTRLPLPSHRLLESQSGLVHIELHPPYDGEFFRGHFPELPVLPGVVLLNWTFALAAEVGFECEPNSLKNLKFTHVIKPDTPLVLELRPDSEKNRVGFTWRNEKQSCASGLLSWSSSNV
ncbi:3-hydroxymyristoyl/3-hydroxydecanoyl-(acyl carrier protein) dehydratase [Alteromonadaceae bacterium 2753L.S.0a.02]|nr:3-hydroxymyristoyl/3-hydroxydecanoyl-(acyl carrier protein) dehydratase [Alteromonadaceae bacterium 2753L.S.0a.02]